MQKIENTGGLAKIETRSKFKQWLSKPFWEKVLMCVESNHDTGWRDTPIAHRSILEYDRTGRDYSVVTFHEEGREIGIGYGNEWRFFITRKNFNRVIWNYFKIWVRYEWFGVRTWLFWFSQKKVWARDKEYRAQRIFNVEKCSLYDRKSKKYITIEVDQECFYRDTSESTTIQRIYEDGNRKRYILLKHELENVSEAEFIRRFEPCYPVDPSVVDEPVNL